MDKPKPSDFKTIAEYVDALVAWEVARQLKGK